MNDPNRPATAEDIRRHMRALGRRPQALVDLLIALALSPRQADRRMVEELFHRCVSIAAAAVVVPRCAACITPLREGPTLRCGCGRAICRHCLRLEELLSKTCRACLDAWLTAQTL